MTPEKATLEYRAAIPHARVRKRWRWWYDALFAIGIAIILWSILAPVFATA